MFDNIHSRLHLPPQALTWSLDYDECTTTELRKFFEERTGTPLDEGQLQKVRDYGSYPLIHRLSQMDREATFPRFMELAPELRLCVYEALLIAPKGKHGRDGIPKIHPAILRTSKQVYSEAMPVLYKKNKFRAEIWYSEKLSLFYPAGNVPVCTLTVNRPGGGFSFHHRTSTSAVPVLRSLFEHSATIHMLRMLTHLTVDIDLVTPRGKQESGEYSIKACDAMKSLCLSMSGASRLKELTIKVKPGNQDSSDIDLTDILWPLLLLRDAITVKFEGITAGLEKSLMEGEKSMEVERSSGMYAAFGQRIALILHLCNAEFEKPGWEGRCWVFHGIREAGAALYALKAPEKQLLSLDDIVNTTPTWKGLQCEAHRLETSDSEQ